MSRFLSSRFCINALKALIISTLSIQTLLANTAVVPVPRLDKIYDNLDGEGWLERHESIKKRNQSGPVDLIFVGDSITHWFKFPGKGRPVWDERFAKLNAVNMGFGGDRTEHVLWRIDNGTLDGISPKLCVLMIGTNNWRTSSSEEIAEGVEAVCLRIQEKLPDTKILLLGIFPRGTPDDPKRAKTLAANEMIKGLHDGSRIHYLDIGSQFLDEDGYIPESVMPDKLHPSTEGYRIWADAIQDSVAKLMAD